MIRSFVVIAPTYSTQTVTIILIFFAQIKIFKIYNLWNCNYVKYTKIIIVYVYYAGQLVIVVLL